MGKINLVTKLEIPSTLLGTIFVILFILVLSPYLGGTDFGIFKIPQFQNGVTSILKILGPLFILSYVILFIPIWSKQSNDNEHDITKLDKQEVINADSKHILQSTPDIILHELDKLKINTSETKIQAGFNINDLNKRITILNPNLTPVYIEKVISMARELAFSEKYAAPKEDEKLYSEELLSSFGLKCWDVYLREFIKLNGIEDVKNITVLDVGIGNAYASYAFLKDCSNLFGIDVSKKALEYAKDKLPNANLNVGSAESLLCIKSFTIDLYLSLRTYQSTLFDIKQSLHEAYRVLARGGRIVISIPSIYFNKNNENKIDSYAKGLIPPYSKKPNMEYALEIANRIKFYLDLLGFFDTNMYETSPYEIYIGGRK